jgi:hypothetical protein
MDLPAGAEVSPMSVGAATTTAAGMFSLPVTDFGPVARAADDESVVSVALSAESPKGQLFYRVRMVFTAPDKLTAYQPDVDSDTDVPDASRSRITGLGSDGIPVLNLVTTQSTPNDVAAPPPPPPAPIDDDPRPPKQPNCDKVDTCTFPTGTDTGSPDVAVEPVPDDPEPVEPALGNGPRTDQPVYDPPTTTVKVKESGLSVDAARAKGSFNPDVWCGGNHWYLKKSKDVFYNHLTLANQATGAGTTGKFKYETTKDTSIEIGVTNRAGKFVTSLGMTKGKKESASVELPIKKNVKAEWWIGYDFHMFDVWCQSNTTFNKWWSGYTEYRPKEFSGDASRRNWAVFACNSRYRSSLGPGATAQVAAGRTATRTGSFAVGTGGTLKVTQTWSKTTTVTYVGVGDDGYGLCGDGGKWPTGVSRTREI